jgi:hypothetical protein
VQGDLANVMQLAGVAGLAGQWAGLVPYLHARAYQDILGALCARGFTPAQVNAWGADPSGQGQSLERDLTACYLLSAIHGQDKVDLTFFIKIFDRREELRTVQVVTAAGYQDPQGTAGLPNTGSFDTSLDTFVANPPPDGSAPDVGPGLGEYTRF